MVLVDDSGFSLYPLVVVDCRGGRGDDVGLCTTRRRQLITIHTHTRARAHDYYCCFHHFVCEYHHPRSMETIGQNAKGCSHSETIGPPLGRRRVEKGGRRRIAGNEPQETLTLRDYEYTYNEERIKFSL